MSSRCSICTSEKAEAVDASLRLGWTQGEVADKFGFSPSAVGRHYRADYEAPVIAYLGEVKEQLAEMMKQEVLPQLQRLREDLELAELELAYARPPAEETP